jgi:hypothetical protein
VLTQTLAPGWDVALRGAASSSAAATELDAFLSVIREQEDALPRRERLNAKLMITRLRKLFYGGRGWDEHLIPGAAGVAPLYRFSMADPTRREFEAPGPNVLDFVDARPRLDGAPAQLVHPGDLQEVRMPGGELVDVGHVLAGLDAINHPARVAPLGLYEMASNVDAVTWAGDLGSALAEVLFQRARLGRPLADAEVQAQIDLCAPPQDMLGNVDAYAIGAAYDISSGAGRAVSDILADYYGAAAAAGLPPSERFTTFVHEVGLGPLDGEAFAAEAAWLRRYERELGHAAALYVGAVSELSGWGLPYAIGAKLALMKAARDAPLRRTLLERFVASLRAEVAREAGQT